MSMHILVRLRYLQTLIEVLDHFGMTVSLRDFQRRHPVLDGSPFESTCTNNGMAVREHTKHNDYGRCTHRGQD